MKRETVSAPVVEEPIRTALRERFLGDCFFWDPKDPDGITLLRAADRARRAGRAFAASMNEADVRELLETPVVPLTKRVELNTGETALLLALRANGDYVWFVLCGAASEEERLWRSLLGPSFPSDDAVYGERLIPCLRELLETLARLTGCSIVADCSKLRGTGWLMPYPTDALTAALTAACLQARDRAPDRCLRISFAPGGEEGEWPGVQVTLTLRGEGRSDPLWKQLAEAGGWRCLPIDPGGETWRMTAIQPKSEILGLKNPLPWDGYVPEIKWGILR